MSGIEVIRPGVVPYLEAWGLQRERADAVRAGTACEALVLLQHPPVYTLGMRGRTQSVLASDAEIAASGAEIVQSDRGGDVTFHGPGQLVAYPILDTHARGLGPASYVRLLEGTLIDALAHFDVEAWRVPGRPGVWTEHGGGLAKIAAVGVRIHHGVSMHGVALNVATDLRWFNAIVPCGLRDTGVTSMAELLAAPPSIEEVGDAFLDAFARSFEATLVQGAGAEAQP